MYKVYASAGYSGYLYPLLRSGLFEEVDQIERADVVLFAGGHDIDPGIYGQQPGKRTYFNPRRDAIEITDYHFCKLAGIPMIGICRGMQLLTAMEGGTLFQHVDNHAGWDHQMVAYDGSIIRVNSLHHQMCNPWAGVKNFKLLGYTPKQLAGTIIGAGDVSVDAPPHEPEALYFPDIQAFAVQWHPEMMHPAKDQVAIQWYLDHVQLLLEDQLHAA